MKASPLRYIPALCLIIPLTLIVASCSSSTDSTTSEDSAPEDSVITAGYAHTCALRQTGTITCWGWNWSGQLGNNQSGDDADSSVPVEVLGITDATQITAGGFHACALRQTGTITCWGNNEFGQLGNGQSGDNADSSVPVEVLGITDATQITAGDTRTCALRQTGTITC